jgi:DNA polymerase III psi subunit
LLIAAKIKSYFSFKGVLKSIGVLEDMVLPPTPKKLAQLLIQNLKNYFSNEINSPVYHVLIFQVL